MKINEDLQQFFIYLVKSNTSFYTKVYHPLKLNLVAKAEIIDIELVICANIGNVTQSD